jgi:hypothetical protein
MQADLPKHLGSLKICAAGKGFHQYLQKSNCTGATLLISARRCQQREASWRGKSRDLEPDFLAQSRRTERSTNCDRVMGEVQIRNSNCHHLRVLRVLHGKLSGIERS